jgi:hypothetical protein
MRKLISIVLIVGFIVVDFLFFHDILKPGEKITAPQYLTGALSILVITLAIQSLAKERRQTKSP